MSINVNRVINKYETMIRTLVQDTEDLENEKENLKRRIDQLEADLANYPVEGEVIHDEV